MTTLYKTIGILLVLGTSSVAQGQPEWEFSERTDPFDDIVSYDAIKLADNYVGGIFFGCEAGGPLASGIFWGKDITSGDVKETEVQIRVGDNPAFNMILSVTNNSASGTEDGGREILEELLTQSGSSTGMIARTTGDLGSAFVEIDLIGLELVAAQLDQYCS